MRTYFLLINYTTKERLLCSWFQNEPNFNGQEIHYIGLTNGLGGYRQMLDKGFIDRRFRKDRELLFLRSNKEIMKRKYDKMKKERCVVSF